MKNKGFIILLTVCLFSLSSFGANLVAEADSAYNAKEYNKAIELYRSVVLAEGTSAPLLFNLGNACYQTGDYGNAMLYWLRARRLDPGNEEINSNIRYLQSRVEDANKAEQRGRRLKVIADEPSFFQSVRSALAEDVASDSWAVSAAIFFILFIGAVALYIFSRTVILRKIGFFGGMICFLFSFVFVVFAFMGAKSSDSRETGVIMPFKVSLLTEPGKESNGEKALVLTKGSKVQILSEEVDAEGTVTWYKVRLNSDYIGWVAASDLSVV